MTPRSRGGGAGNPPAAGGTQEGTRTPPREGLQHRLYKIAIGLIGLPVPPTTGNGLAANKNM